MYVLLSSCNSSPNLGVCVHRISGPAAVTWHWLYTALWVFLFSAHVCYLALIKFDYGYNMAASVGAGTTTLITKLIQINILLVR